MIRLTDLSSRMPPPAAIGGATSSCSVAQLASHRSARALEPSLSLVPPAAEPPVAQPPWRSIERQNSRSLGERRSLRDNEDDRDFVLSRGLRALGVNLANI